MSGHYLDLSANPLRFQPIGKSVNVFFDEANRQVSLLGIGIPVFFYEPTGS